MNSQELIKFLDWLISTKGFQRRSARDVISRLKRISNEFKFDSSTSGTALELIEKRELFPTVSTVIRSQLKRSLRLFIEFYN